MSEESGTETVRPETEWEDGEWDSDDDWDSSDDEDGEGEGEGEE